MVVITLVQKVNSNSVLSHILNEIKDNPLLAPYKITDNKGVYSFIYKYVVDDMKLFLNNQKNELDKTTKYMLQKFFNKIHPFKFNSVTKKYERPNLELPFDKEFVVYYLNVLNDVRDMLSSTTDHIFDTGDEEQDNNDEAFYIDAEKDNQNWLFGKIVIDILGVNAYIFIEQMKALKQNAVQKVEIETLSTQKKIPEDVQNIISGFASNQIKGGRKSKKRGLNKKRKSIKKKKY